MARKIPLAAPVAGIMLLALLLRLHDLKNLGFNVDEFIETMPLGCESLRDYLTIFRLYAPDHTPVSFVLRYFWCQWLGTTMETMRWLGVLFGVGAVPVIVLVARRLYDARTGLVAALLFGVSPMFIAQAQIARPYAFLTLFVLLSAYSFLRMLEGTTAVWWGANALTNIVMILVHPFGAFVLLSEGILLLLRGELRRRVFLGWGAFQALVLGAMIIPWILSAPRNPPDAGGMPDNLLVFLEFLFGEDLARLRGSPSVPQGTMLGWLSHPVLVELSAVTEAVILAFFFAALALFLWNSILSQGAGRRRQDAPERRHAALRFVFLVALPGLPWLIMISLDQFWRPCFQERYASTLSTIALYVLGGRMILSCRAIGLRWTLLASLLLAYAYQLALYFPGPEGNGQLAVGREIRRYCEPTDVVLVRSWVVEWDQFRHEAGQIPAPIVPFYSYKDMSNKLLGYLEQSANRPAVARAKAWVVAYPEHGSGDFRRDAFEGFLKSSELEYSTRFFYGDEPALLYQIAAPGMPAASAAAIPPEFVSPLDPEGILTRLGLTPADEPLWTESRCAIGEVLTLWFDDPDIYLPLFVGMPALELGYPLFAKRLSEYCIAQRPKSKISHLLMAMALDSLGDIAGADQALLAASRLNEGGANRYSAYLEPLILATRKQGDLPQARSIVERLDKMGVICPYLLRVKAGMGRSFRSNQSF